MVFAVVFRRASVCAARAAQGFLSQRCQSLHSTPVCPFIMRRICPRIEPSELFSSRALARFSSSIQKTPEIDAELLRIVDLEIVCAKEECREVEAPEDFPFKIQDVEGRNSITLQRDFHGENIEVVVSMPAVEETYANDETGEEENHDTDENAEKNSQPTICLTVNISKGGGSSFEVCCTAYADGITIDSLHIRENKHSDDLLAYEGPDFNDLDENLQKAFNKYLEVRGITTAVTSFLYEYLLQKDAKEYLLWLQNVKQFVSK